MEKIVLLLGCLLFIIKWIILLVVVDITSSMSTFLDTKTSRLLIRLMREDDDDDADCEMLIADGFKSVTSSVLVVL